MEALVYIIIGVVAAVFGLRSFKGKNKDAKKALEYHKKEAALKTKQEIMEKRLAEIKKNLENSQIKQKGKSKEEIEEFWKK